MNTFIQPLATRMRPRTLHEVIGQQHLLGPGKPLRRALEGGGVHSMILWGPPGTGKTTLAHVISANAQARIENFSAVLNGVKDIREAVVRAKQALETTQQRTVIFVDEVHRFNKSQQDAFLPHIEDGTFILVGATTENPSFELNNALLSRVKVYVLKPLEADDIKQVIDLALADVERGLGAGNLQIADELRQYLAMAADGDARRALTLLDLAAELADEIEPGKRIISETILGEILRTGALRRFDKQGDDFYDQISALHKSVRGSDPDAALYWLCRMIDGGCDPHYLARRIVRMASEDIGNADPRGLELALNAWQAWDRLGSPEGELALAQAVIYLACAPKSNAVYLAYNTVMQDIQKTGSLPVPNHIRNAPTKLMQELGYGKNYRYAHDEPNAYAAGENYFPPELGKPEYYKPVERGLEIKIREKLASLRALDKVK